MAGAGLMSQRVRDRRQRGLRYAGVLRDGSSAQADERPAPEHYEARSRPVSWRLASLTIVICLGIMLALFFSADAFYVRSVAVGGIRYLTKEEVFAFADIANLHVFWVSPTRVRENLLRSPSIADARVTIDWPPNMVNIVVVEREPALIWEQGGAVVWVDLQGRVMAQREERSDLMRIRADITVDRGPLGNESRLEPQFVVGALQLQEALPSAGGLRYDAVRGLGVRTEAGVDVWFGDGLYIPEKLRIYQSITQNLQQRGIQPVEINIVDPDHPFYTSLWGR